MRLKLQFTRNIVRSPIFHVAKDRSRPDQNVGVPDRRHAEILMRLNRYEDSFILVHVFDRLHSFAFGEREEWPLHRVFLDAEA